MLQEFVDGPHDIEAALLSTADGRMIAVASRLRLDAARMAAIAGSLLSLAEACVRELHHGTCRHALVDGVHGATALLRIQTPQGPWTLTTVGARGASLGLLFACSRDLAEDIAACAGTTASG